MKDSMNRPDSLCLLVEQQFEQVIGQLLRPAVARHNTVASANLIWNCIGMIFVCGFCSGLIIGSFGWLSGQRSMSDTILQMVYSGIKVPLLLLASFILSVPAFYVLNALFGLSARFAMAITNVLICQAVVAVVLMAVSPMIGFYYLSIEPSQTTYQLAILVNAFAFTVSSFAAQQILRQRYHELILENCWHRAMLWFWSAVYAFNGIQMGWVLRPFIGNPGQATTFLRSESWDNAYVKVFQIVRSLF